MLSSPLAGVRAISTALLLSTAGLAQADIVFYSNTFEGGAIGPEWSANATRDYNPNFTHFMGRKTNETVRLTLAVPPGGRSTTGTSDDGDGDGSGGGSGGGGGTGGGGGSGGGTNPQPRVYTLTFDLYTIDSWDGLGPQGPDYFEVLINSQLKFSETFATGAGLPQSARQPDIGPMHLGYNTKWHDAIYRDITIEFTLPESAQSIAIDFRGRNLQSVNDESWGIDNVRLSHTPIPAPGPILLAGLASLAGATRRRRQA